MPIRAHPVLALLAGGCLALPALEGSAAALESPAPGAGTHWAYRPLEIQPPPTAGPEAGGRNPVDAFIRSRLRTAGLSPAPEADRATLLRRVTFDLTGLPPTPDELQAFTQDRAPDAYERAVDRLLSSPRHGERQARYWMDAAHFAETHGHDQDRIRTNAWPYRDYLIASFNQDKPYERFLREQIAGDVLFPEDPGATVALGFVAAGPWDESSLRDIREDTLDRQIGRYLDRDDMVMTVMSVLNSTTVHCARCHDHKFDPVSQRDYYALQAVFAGVERANRTFDTDPGVHRRRQELRNQLRQAERRDAGFLLSADSRSVVADWEAAHAGQRSDWKVSAPEEWQSSEGTRLTLQPDQSLLATGATPERDTYTVRFTRPAPVVTALRLEVLPDDSLPQKGPGRAENGNLHLSEVTLQCVEPTSSAPREIPFARAFADFNQADWNIAAALDGKEATAWGIHPREGQSHQAVFELKEPLRLPEGARLVVSLRQLHGRGHVIGRFRVSFTGVAAPRRPQPAEMEAIASLPQSQRSRDQELQLAAWVLEARIRAELAALPPPLLVYAAASDFEPDGGLKPSPVPREVRVLRRGEITRPEDVAQPGSLACVSTLPSRFTLSNAANEGERRAALAGWLAAHDNPLTWRSIVNRVWQQHFGRGLVDTPNDFGKMGGMPSHPELLDWLAVWFRDDARGSLKALHRLLVTSATYRQAATAPPALDADNRLLSRMNRTRLDAECVRDALLLASGRLDFRMGGPSDRQFDLKPGIHVTPKVDYTLFDLDSAEGSRRSVYRFLFRTLPDPFFEALDCPAGDQLTGVRHNSVTVQQALALWNNPVVARQSEHFAEALSQAAPDIEAQVTRACEWAWGRNPKPDEAAELAAFARRHGLANLGRLLFNSNEFMFVD